MTESNRLRLVGVKETTRGTTPNTPRMRTMRITGESLAYKPDFVDSDEIRDDRMNADPIKVGETNSGGVNFEWHVPPQDSLLWSLIESGFVSTWTAAPSFDNDGTADSVITDAGTTTDTYVVASGGASVKAGHLVRATGFTNSANNQIFRAASSTGTTIVGSSISLTAETAPPAAARLKVIGFQGASADITATTTGLGSTALDFTTLGLTVGQWIKIGGTGAGNRFATAALNAWVRVTAISATALTCDNLPAGWTTDAGTGKTIKVFFGDVIKNGTTRSAVSLERGFLGQTTPTYILQAGMHVNQLEFGCQAKQKATGMVDFMGMSGSQSTTAQDASPDAAPSIADYQVLAGSANVGSLSENGSALSSPNWARNFTVRINNNLRMVDAVDSVTAVDVTTGSCDVAVTLDTYFGSNSLYSKLLAGTATNLNTRLTKGSGALVWSLPRLTPRDGNPNAGAKNQDVTLPLNLSASYDSTTGCHVMLNRFEYFEA